MNHKLVGLISLSIAVLMVIGAVAVTPDSLSADIGTKVNISITGLTDASDYKITDSYDKLVEAFTTSGTTHSTKVSIVINGDNDFTLSHFTNGSVITTFTIVGTDPIDEIYIIFPLILMFAVVTAVMKFFNNI
jgi:hypothetical protein